jgi:hypothetical protein
VVDGDVQCPNDNAPLQEPPPKARAPVPRKKPRQQYKSTHRKVGDSATHRPGKHAKLTKSRLHQRLVQHDKWCQGQSNGNCKMSSITVEAILEVWKEQLSWTEPELAARLLTHLKEHCLTNSASGRTTYQWDGQHLCREAYLVVWGVSSKKLKPVRALLREGASVDAICHGNTGAHLEPKREWVDAWSSKYLRENCDEYTNGIMSPNLMLVSCIAFSPLTARIG